MTVAWVAALLAVCALAGVAGALRVRAPLGSMDEGRLGAFAVCALAVLVLVPALLARIGILHTAGAVVGGLLVVAVSVALLARSVRAGLPALDLRRIGLVVAIVTVLAAPQLLAVAVRTDSVPVGTPWYFWNLAQEYAADGEVPATSQEFGTETSALADYTGYSAGTALLALHAGGPDGIHAAQVMRAIAALGTALGFLLLARAWGASLPSAVGGAAILVSLAYFAGKLSSYRPEGFGYPLLLLLPALALAYLRTRERSLLVVLGLGVAALSQIHGISFTVAGALLAATFATRVPALVRERSAELRRVLPPMGAILAGWWGADLVLSGRLTQTGKATSVPRVIDGVDPTLAFMRAVRAEPGDTFPVSAGELIDATVRSGFYLHRAAWQLDLWWVVLAAAAVALVGALVTRARGAGTLVAFAGVALGIVVAICLAFQVGWETYVPRRTGWSRFLGQALLLVPLVGAAAIGLGRAARWARVMTVIWLVLGLGVFATSSVAVFRVHQSQASEATLSSLRALDLPDGAVLTTNAYSEGFVAAVLHREAVTNGRGPYHQAELLDLAVDQLDAARAYFAAPAAAGEYLDERGVTHVLVGTEPYLFGTTQLYAADLAGLAAAERLERVADGPGFVLYEVRPSP